ncbi:MAG: hypothetical protein H7Z38_15865 [Rubrivivax sp.]|nr:hypothetical protein [Pyrinomonadaceae bacterium]
MPDIVVVYRRHVPWGAPPTCVIDEPVEICRLSMIKFQLIRLRHDARDLQGVSFIYRFVLGVPDADLCAVRAHISLEEQVHLALRFVERDFYTRE